MEREDRAREKDRERDDRMQRQLDQQSQQIATLLKMLQQGRGRDVNDSFSSSNNSSSSIGSFNYYRPENFDM